ncbi:PHP domain-containing protein [Modestobacter sp. NPDC049651]|uniref:PHP domain-containing protein n=1 Tax=unclassified Modestobacter TaxID=2643866 RepID=UPI0033D706C1
MRIDLHTHSAVSDGTDSPAALLAAAVGAGLDVVALTDHDTTAGWALAEQARPAGLTVVPGMEMSCRWLPGDQPPISVHLLAYLFDPQHPAFAAERARLREERLTRGERIVANLVAAGYPVQWAQIVEDSAGGVVGRPHIARALVDAGVVSSVDQAFATLLDHRSPHYVTKADTDVVDGIALVRAAGGVPVFAHGLATKRGRVVGDDAIRAMADAGLLGLEVDHPDHSLEERAHLRALADELGLLRTGSSDYHGTNKVTPIGACTTDPEQYARLVELGTGHAVLTG